MVKPIQLTDDHASSRFTHAWYERLVLATRSKLKAALLKMLSPAEADEVLQEAYLKLFEVSQTAIPENPQGYVYRVARNLAINRLRNKDVARKFLEQRSDEIEVIDADNRSYDALKSEQHNKILQQVISQLPPVCRQVFVLRKLHGHSHKSIAEMLNISTKTVENHVAKGMRACFDAFRKHPLHTSQPKRQQRG